MALPQPFPSSALSSFFFSQYYMLHYNISLQPILRGIIYHQLATTGLPSVNSCVP